MEPKAKNWYLSTITEVFRDQYVDPSNEWTALPKKALQNEFLRFAQKKHQAETRHLEDPNDQYNLHFDFYLLPDSKIVPFDNEEWILDFLLPAYSGERLINTGRELRKGLLGLKWILSNNGCLIPKRIQEKFREQGIYIESVPLNKSDIKRIAVQSFAQIIAYDVGCQNVLDIKDCIFNCDQNEGKLMHITNWHCFNHPSEQEDALPKDQARTIQRMIASMPKNAGYFYFSLTIFWSTLESFKDKFRHFGRYNLSHRASFGLQGVIFGYD